MTQTKPRSLANWPNNAVSVLDYGAVGDGATDDTYSAGAYGSLGLERGAHLIPFAELTEEVVVGWVKDKFGPEKVTEIEAALQAQLDEQRQPTKAGGLPWS